MKVAILAVYFGNLPPFAQLFLASCDKNKSVDFLLIGDAWRAVEGDVPENCYVQGIDLDEFKVLSEKHTGIKPTFTSPYKICDYKPTLGEVFQKELVGYDYWGFCDIDIILGNLSSFLEHLELYDVFSTRREYLSGPLFFFRNTAPVNGLYRQSKDVDHILGSSSHFSFTECALAWVELHSGKSILEISTPVESMTEVIMKAVEKDQIKANFETLSLEPARCFRGKANVCNGQVSMKGNQFILYHHHRNKGRSLYTYPQWHWAEVPDGFFISKYGVYAKGLPNNFKYRFLQFYKCWIKRIKKQICGYNHSLDVNATKIT